RDRVASVRVCDLHEAIICIPDDAEDRGFPRTRGDGLALASALGDRLHLGLDSTLVYGGRAGGSGPRLRAGPRWRRACREPLSPAPHGRAAPAPGARLPRPAAGAWRTCVGGRETTPGGRARGRVDARSR